MSKKAFLDALRVALCALPPDEREAALEFYDELIEDAGPENEQRVIEELGSPQEVAKQILAGSGMRYTPPAYTPPPYRAPERKRLSWWVILLLVLGFPVWLPLLILAVVLPFVGLVVAAALIFTLVIVVFSLLLAGGLSLFLWVVTLGGQGSMPPFFSAPSGLAGLGASLAVLGLGLLLFPPCVSLFTRGIPAMWSKLISLWRRKEQ